MAARAARWVDDLLPRVAVRQVVLTVPWSRRWLLARKPDLVRGVLRIGLDVVMGWYREQALAQVRVCEREPYKTQPIRLGFFVANRGRKSDQRKERTAGA
jgi:hypothetical protein